MTQKSRLPFSWIRAVIDGTDPATAEAVLAEEQRLRDNAPMSIVDDEYLADEAVRYRSGKTDVELRRQELRAADPGLEILAGLVDQRDQLDQQIRSLTCLFREWGVKSVSLADLGVIEKMSASGVRSSYTDDERDYVRSVLGVSPSGSRDPERPRLVLPSPYGSDVYVGVGASGDPVVVPAGESILVDIPLDDVRRRSVEALLAYQLAARILPGFPTLSVETCVNGAAVLNEHVWPDPQWRYQLNAAIASGEQGGAVVPDGVGGHPDVLPRLRLVATLDGDVALSDQVPPQWLIGHVGPIAAANPGRFYVLKPPSRTFRWQWTLTAPDGQTRDVHLASVAGMSIDYPNVSDTQTGPTGQLQEIAVNVVRARLP